MALLRRQLQIIADRQRAVLSVFHERLDSLSDTQLRWSPDPKTWSPILTVDHLIRVNVATSPLFMKALLPAPLAGEEVEKELPYSFLDRTIVQALGPDARFKLPVPKMFTPVEHRGPDSRVLRHLYDEFDAFAVILEYANEKKLKGIHVPSPANAHIHPSLLAYLDASVQHNRYHWLQIEAVLRNPKFPAS
jgi:hypothetical protein